MSKQITNGSGRIVRSPTRGLSLQKKRRSKQKLDIVIHRTLKRIVGPHAMDFKTEACVIVKQNTPLEYARWKDIPKEIKLKLWMGMKVKGEANISYICSRYDRAPELIFGAAKYKSSIDIWSAGCVLAELLLGQVPGTPTREEVRCMIPNYTDFRFPQI